MVSDMVLNVTEMSMDIQLVDLLPASTIVHYFVHFIDICDLTLLFLIILRCCEKKISSDEKEWLNEINKSALQFTEETINRLNTVFCPLKNSISPLVNKLHVHLDVFPDKEMRERLLANYSHESIVMVCVSVYRSCLDVATRGLLSTTYDNGVPLEPEILLRLLRNLSRYCTQFSCPFSTGRSTITSSSASSSLNWRYIV